MSRRLDKTAERREARGTADKDRPRTTGRTRRGRRLFAPLRRLTTLVTVLIAAVVVVALLLGAGLLNLLPHWSNPFGERTVDRSAPAVLKSVQDLSRYEAASGTFQVVVDLDKDARFLPSSVLGRRTLYVGTGSVDAYVDLGSLTRGGVTVDKDRTAAKVVLPRARLERTSMDPKHSYTVAQERGFFDRISDFFSSNPGDQQKVQQLAVTKIHNAAVAAALTHRAELNTKSAVTGLLTSLGFKTVTITFQPTH